MVKLLFILFCFLVGGTARAEFQVPALRGPVMDGVGVLDRSDARELAQLLYDYNQVGKAQIQVLILPSLEGEPIEQAAIKIADAWKLGTAKADNGILFLVAVNDHQLRIEVGQGLEGALPDITAKRIISDTVVPMLRAGRASDGIVVGVHEIIRVVDKEFADNHKLATPEKRKSKSGAGLFLILILIILILNRISRGGGRGGGGSFVGGLAGGLLGGGLGGGGFGGGGGGGGSSWSGGGGGFSGGGASGSW